MPTSPLHDPDRYMADLRQILSQGRKRIGIFIGAGAPVAIRVDENNHITEDGQPLIPDVAGLTDAVVDAMPREDQERIALELLVSTAWTVALTPNWDNEFVRKLDVKSARVFRMAAIRTRNLFLGFPARNGPIPSKFSLPITTF